MRKRASAPLVVVTGLPDGLERLFAEEYEAMYRLVVAMLGNESEAEGVVQDAFVAVSTRWESLENPGGYLRVSVVNGARKKMRSSSRRQRAETQLKSEAITSVDSGTNDYLLDLLDGLPDRQRAALVLTYYGGLDSAEVGEALECPASTVRSLVRRALADLREVVDR